MALSTQRASASSVSNESAPRWKYDVFLSFRGLDTRKGFVSHLYHELCKCQGITTFFDDRELEGGTSIHLELPSAIKESHIAIVVLSPNYASSKWCLNELTTILQCMEARNTVLPVFYETNPSDVGNQRGSFAKAFDEHEEKLISTEDKMKVTQWREALEKVSKISGWHSKESKCERELIEKIVQGVWRKVQATFTLSDSSQKLVGIDSALEQLSLLLAHDANDVRFIGITGMGGIGKTTLAKLVYYKILHHFEVHCFLGNVREVSNVDLQKSLLFPMLKERIEEIWDEQCGSIFTKKYLCNKKVLLVLDDVDHINKLQVLAGKEDWFGMGSRIIITTRNERLLDKHGITLRHNVEVLNRLSSKDDRKYDIFLSFGGEDTRKTFTDHLHCTLTDHQFKVFMYESEYDYKLEKSNGAIPEHLIQAIERSKVAVVIFSRGYPESVWCLEELVKIMECTKTLDQIFFPIFYDVDPSDVLNQTGSFAQAFQKYEWKIEGEKVHLWRNALKEAGVMAGLNFKDTDGNEGNFIRAVIAQITGKLSSTTCLELPTTTRLVGIDSRLREISKHLDVGGSNDLRIIGILGMCGLGKTTVAKAVFNKHHRSFDGASFLENVRGKKLVDLQKQLISNILKSACIVVSSIDEGTKEIEQRLRNIRVLVVIDDLNSVEQLDALATKPDSFGPGSRIIITSRNEHLLKILNVDKICPLPAMNEREALELLSWHAFGKNYPKEEYVELSMKAVGYCGGLPLALEVLGSYLCTKSTNEWETVLDKWKISQPYREIHRTLEISYDGLIDDDVKAIFLDISCFFTGMNKDYVMTVLDGCQFYPKIGIQELQDQCLVTVDEEGNLMMHDLIQSMGREIVRAESPDNPGKRSRLWHNEDITDVLTEQSGTEDVEGLTLDMQASDELSFSSESFRNMQSLRLLKLNNIKLNGSCHNLSKELRWLCWHGFPLEFIPKDFDQPNLVAVDLRYSKLIRVWEDSDLLFGKLKLLNLSHSHNLAQTPDFSKLPNLKELILNDCESLSEVHSSIGNLERLALVNLEGCKNLKDLPLNFFNSKSIETLLLNGCSRFENLAEGLGRSYHKTADGIPIRQILKLRFSSQHGVKKSPSTSLLPPSLHGFNSLRKLDLGCCTLTDDEIPKDLGSLISLEDLDLRKNSFCSLPSLSGLSKLETLCLDDCTNLRAIPNLPTNLKVLRAALCTALETMPDFSELSNMRELYLSHSCKLTKIPGLDVSLNSMTRIHMEGCINLTTDFRKNILQGWTSCGYGGIFLNGNLVPDWFEFVERDLVSFHIPLVVGRNFCGLTLFCIYSSKKQHEGPLGILVSNKTKRIALVARITYASVPTSCTLDDHYLWQGQISNYVLSLQGGDEVDIFVKPVETADASVRVERIGVNLVWDKFMNENMHDSHLHLYDFDQHPDPFLGADGYEGIGRELKSNYLKVAEHPVGIDSRVLEISNYLDVGGSNDVRIIGIWGMGGLGKSTIAKAIFNKYQHRFGGASFLPNVREDKKLVDSQNKLLFDILRLGHRKVSMPDEGTKEINTRLRHIKVLVIIDDVDSVRQVNALAIKHDSFGPGSRIVITTRDKHLLHILCVDEICSLRAMNEDEALELLSRRAFRKNYPDKEYLEVAREAVEYCGGLPLALKAVGSYLHKRTTREWTSALNQWKRSQPCQEIHKILKISYDGLTDDQVKDIFLDLSCFFIGMDKDRVMAILDGCYHDPTTDIEVLQERCLVTVDPEGNLMMHSLIRDMGREIVRAKSPKKLGNRCRLWHHEDVTNVLRGKCGMGNIEGIALDSPEPDKLSCRTETFRNMRNLRLLKIKGVKFTGDCKHLPDELRWLSMSDFPLQAIPEDFNQPNAVDIDLSYSNIQVWNDNVSLEKLKFLNLGSCENLKESPDFSRIPNIERLILEACRSLSKIHHSIVQLKNLKYLSVANCKNLQEIPDLPTKLEILKADECIALEKMPNFSEMSSMVELHLNHSPKLTEIQGLDKSLNTMTRIHIERCTNLTAAFKKAILQEWSASGNGDLFLPGNDLPSGFTCVDPKDETFVQHCFGYDAKALTLCVVYSSDDSESRHTEFSTPLYATEINRHESYIWLRHLSNNKLNVSGEKINVGAHLSRQRSTDDIHLRVQKIGVYQEQENLVDEFSNLKRLSIKV